MKAAIIKYFFLLELLLISGCRTSHKNLISVITSSNCYWDVHDTYSTANGKISYCYKFSKDGRCNYLFTLDKKGVRDEYNFGDNIPTTKTWKIDGDTAFYILGIERTVIRFSKDTLLLENPVSKVKDTLIKNCN